MGNTLINKEIIENRQEKAPKLKKQRERLRKLKEALTAADQSQAFENKPQKIRHYIKEVSELAARIERKVRLFEKGVINIAVAGTEKAGKTTFLKNLTGIKDLPDAKERCTAVSCEITHVADPGREGITVVYYKEDELLDIINCEVDHLNKGDKTIWKNPEEYAHAPLQKVENLSAFSSMRLPGVGALSSMAALNYGPALEHLHAIQKALGSNFSLLGQEREDSIANLRTLAAHPNATDQQPLINRLLVRKCYPNGDEHQCLCDTPGVDDPNPHALRRTLKTLKEDTDMLVILDRPKDSPSIAGSLAQFIANLGQMSDKDYPIRERAIFLVNRYEPADPDGKCAEQRLEEVRERNVIPNLPDPCDVTKEASLNQFKAYLNKQLNEVLPREDEKMIQSLWDEISNLENGVRNEVIKPLQEQAPKLPSEMENAMRRKFGDWFRHRADNFRDRLNKNFGNLTSKICQQREHDKKLEDMLVKVSKIKKACGEAIWQRVRSEVTEGRMQDIIDSNKFPIEEVFSEFQDQLSDYIDKLAEVAAEIGPHVQELVDEVLSKTLTEPVMQRLCSGSDAAARLKSLSERLETESSGADMIIEGIKKLVDIRESAKYVSLDELRPALNLLDSLRWTYARKDSIKKPVVDVLEKSSDSKTKEMAKYLKDEKTQLPSRSAPGKEFSDFARKVIFAALCFISEKLESNRVKYQSLLEDGVCGASMRLCTRKGLEGCWENVLGDLKQYIFPDEYANQREKSANAAKCRELIDALRNAIGDESNR